MPEIQQEGPRIVEIPPKVLDKLIERDPESLDRILGTLAGLAIKEGSRLTEDLKTLQEKLSPDSPHKAKAQELIENAEALTKDVKNEIQKEKVTPTEKTKKEQVSGWTPELLAKFENKMKARTEKENKERRQKKIEALKSKLLITDSKFISSLGELNTEIITGIQEKRITAMENMIIKAAKNAGLTDVEQMQLIYQLPNFREAKTIWLNWQKNKLTQEKTKIEARYKSGALKPDIIPGGKSKKTRLIWVDNQIDGIDDEFKRYGLAA
jgi:hypothetical protein